MTIERKKTIAIYGLSFTLFAFIFNFILSPFLAPGPLADAPSKIKKFRGNLTLRRKKADGVYYEIADMKAYVDTFDKWIPLVQNPKNPPSDTLKWVIGFYWILKSDDDGIIKNDYCIIPTLVSKKYPRDVKDYYDDISLPADQQHYNHSNDLTTKLNLLPMAGGGNAVDNGQLWP